VMVFVVGLVIGVLEELVLRLVEEVLLILLFVVVVVFVVDV
jgi:hypothetical protein